MTVASVQAAYRLIPLWGTALPSIPRLAPEKKRNGSFQRILKIIISTYKLVHFPVKQITPIIAYIFLYVKPFKYLEIRQGVNKS